MLIRKKIQKNILSYLIVLSILLHFVFVYKFPIFIKSETPKANDDLIIIEPIQKKPKKIKKPLKKIEDLKGEIVDLTTEEDNKQPEDTKYLSDRNRSVDKETEAQVKTHIPTPLNLENFYADAFNNHKANMQEKESKLNDKLHTNGDYFSTKNIRESNDNFSKQEHYNMFLKSQIDFNTPYDPNYLEGLEQGDLTRLNTKEFLYSGFFTRVKRQIASLWRPDETFGRIQKFNSIIYTKIITTTVSITLNSNGYLVGPNVFVITSSGFADWDNESVRCVREAAPFLNPPKGLADSSGNITFTFAFIGEMRPVYNNMKR